MRALRRHSGATITLVFLIALLGLVGCQEPPSTDAGSPSPPIREGELFRVGSLPVYETDLERRLQEQYGGRRDEQTRQAALDDLVERAQFVQAALEAGLADDPIVREEFSRLLASRLREAILAPRLKQELAISDQRLRELYDEQLTRFQSPEKRQVAVLWLDSGPDPERTARYIERMNQARDFALQTKDIVDHPEKGFSILSIDHSEHAASRFRGGLVG